MERYNPMEAEAFREQRLKEANRKLDEIYIEYGTPHGFDYQIDAVKDREATFLFQSGAIEKQDIILEDRDPDIDPARRNRFAQFYDECPRERETALVRKAYEQHPELFVVTKRIQKQLDDLKETVIPGLEEDIWSLSPRPTIEQIQDMERKRLRSNTKKDRLAKVIREIEACANYELGSSKILDEIRFAYHGYTQEDFATLFSLLNQSFQEIYDKEIPSRAEMLQDRARYDIGEQDALSEQSIP